MPPKKRQPINTAKLLIGLEAMDGPCKGSIYVGKTNRITIGRTRINNFFIKDSLISERHAIIEWNGGKWTITDLGSSNGTSLNGNKVMEGEAVILENEDNLLLGLDTKLRVEIRPIIDPSATTREWLEQECKLLVQRLKIQMEKTALQMREEANKTKINLRDALEV